MHKLHPTARLDYKPFCIWFIPCLWLPPCTYSTLLWMKAIGSYTCFVYRKTSFKSVVMTAIRLWIVKVRCRGTHWSSSYELRGPWYIFSGSDAVYIIYVAYCNQHFRCTSTGNFYGFENVVQKLLKLPSEGIVNDLPEGCSSFSALSNSSYLRPFHIKITYAVSCRTLHLCALKQRWSYDRETE